MGADPCTETAEERSFAAKGRRHVGNSRSNQGHLQTSETGPCPVSSFPKLLVGIKMIKTNTKSPPPGSERLGVCPHRKEGTVPCDPSLPESRKGSQVCAETEAQNTWV